MMKTGGAAWLKAAIGAKLMVFRDLCGPDGKGGDEGAGAAHGSEADPCTAGNAAQILLIQVLMDIVAAFPKKYLR